MTELVHVPFHGGEVLAVEVDGKPNVILRPALERLGVDYSTQLAKMRRRSWASVGHCPTQDQYRDMVTVDVRTFLMLLATMDENRVAPEIKPLLIAYQKEVADVIEAHFTKMRKPEAPETYAPRTLTLDETCALLEQRYGLSYSVPTLARALRNCGVLKQTGGPMKKYRWWFWFTGSTWNVHPHVVVQMARRLDNAEEQLRAFDGIQLRLESEGVGQQTSIDST